MNVVLIGSGNVATVLGKKILLSGHKITGVYSRNSESGEELASKLNTGFIDNKNHISTNADIYLVAISDHELNTISSWLNLQNKLVVHTAGSVKMDVLKGVSRNYGVMYPLQSLNKLVEHIPEIPFFVSGNTPEDLTLIYDFASTLSAKVKKVTDEQRMKMHIAAIFVNNFTNYLYTITEEFCREENVDFRFMMPLIEETTHRLKTIQPGLVQTGPAIRKDEITINKHLSLLETNQELKEWYRLFSDRIKDFKYK